MEEEGEEWEVPDGTAERRWGRMDFMELRTIGGFARVAAPPPYWGLLVCVFLSWAFPEYIYSVSLRSVGWFAVKHFAQKKTEGERA